MLKHIASDLRGLIVQKAFLYYFSGASALSLLAYNAKQLMVEVLQTPVPIWKAIIMVALVSVYIYLRTARIHSSESPIKESFFNSSGYRWRLLSISPKEYSVSGTPMCIKHDKNLAMGKHNFICNAVENEQVCETSMPRESLLYFHRVAESDIEFIKRKKYKV